MHSPRPAHIVFISVSGEELNDRNTGWAVVDNDVDHIQFDNVLASLRFTGKCESDDGQNHRLIVQIHIEEAGFGGRAVAVS